MLISTKGRYGVMIMVYLAENYNNGHKPLKEIAASQDYQKNILNRLLIHLQRQDFWQASEVLRADILSQKLPQKSLSVTFSEYLKVLLAPVYCVAENGETCNKLNSCNSVVVWKKIKDAIDNVVDNMTLNDLIEDKK